MTRSFSELPREPVHITHVTCGSSWDFYGIEWPPQVVVCTACRAALQICGVDPTSQFVTFRQT